MNDTSPILFLLNIAGAAALLIWAVRLVRTGVERGFSTQLRQWLRHSSGNRVLAAGSGLGAAVFLQSSTAVAVLVSNFIAKGGLATTTGLAILLGADVGSALVSQLLVVRQPFLIPLLLLLGVSLFLRASDSGLRQTGRILIGLSLIFVSLDMIRMATGPMVGNPATQAVMGYLGGDVLTAFLIGAAFAWLVHSSVAAVLLFVTLAAQGVLPVSAAAAMVLGANLGGSFIAYVLTLSAPTPSRQMVVANLVLRGGGAALAAIVINSAPDVMTYLGADPSRQVINLHLAFNVVLAVAALPLTGPITKLIDRFVTENARNDVGLETTSALDTSALKLPTRGLDCVARELLAMGQRIEQMLRAVDPLFDKWDAPTAKAIAEQDKIIKRMHLDVKLYLARLSQGGLDENLGRRSMDLASISTNLDVASDAISRIMVELVKDLNAEGFQFSDKGRAEVSDFADRVLGNVQLALNVLMNQNPAEARELLAAKEKVRAVEQKLQRNHLGRLQQGLSQSIETSQIHQETLRALKLVNTSFAAISVPILAKSGDLLKSRLS